MRDDDAEVKVCVDQNVKSGGNNLKSFEIFLWNRKKKERYHWRNQKKHSTAPKDDQINEEVKKENGSINAKCKI